MVCSNEHVEQWRWRRQAYLRDVLRVIRDQDVDRRRPHARQEMTQRLHSFLDGGITLTTFNTAFQQHVHRAWNTFRLQGTFGGMFLNRLISYVPSEETFGRLFHLMFRVPDETAGGPHQMQAIVQFLERLIVSGQVTRASSNRREYRSSSVPGGTSKTRNGGRSFTSRFARRATERGSEQLWPQPWRSCSSNQASMHENPS